MSKTVDERVVSMQFDNKNFERNVSTSMSTLDKLKQKLNLTGAAKGLEDINSSANKVNMSGLANGVETVSAKFSALQVMGVTALANITNSAVNAGKRIVSALTIEPVKDGFDEYEMTLNAVQTTMAGTGKTAEEVEKELKKLDDYADKTVYSSSDMFNNLPKFTNAGVELETATKAMIGIANATALAGGGANQASIAFYNLGQSIGTGYLTRMDYNSINNAGIATMDWKNAMIEAAIAQGTLTKVGEDAYKAGGKTYTLQQLFIDGLQQQWASADVLIDVFGDYGDETTEIGKKAWSAAQDVKTFTMMMESLKATAGTGWKDTWQLIFGGLDEAKEFWTGLSNFISNILTKMADFRNSILESALGKNFKHLADQLNNIMSPVTETIDTVKGALLDYDALVDEIIAGKWGNAPTRWQDLTKAGYDWAHAQNLVNEKLGCSVRHATDYVESQDTQTKSTEKLTDANADLIEDLVKLSDAQLEEMGYSKEQIAALRELEKVAKKLGLSISDLVKNIDEIDDRWLLINSFKNIGNMLTGIGKAIKEAWTGIFPEATVENFANKLFDMIAGFHRFTVGLKLIDDETGELTENGEKLRRTFSGIFALIDIVCTILGGPLKIVIKIISQLLDALGFNILDITAEIGDAIVGFNTWLDSVLDFSGIFEVIAPYIKKATDAVRQWVEETKPFEKIGKVFKSILNGMGAVFKWIAPYIESAAKAVKTWIDSVKPIEKLGKAFNAVSTPIKNAIIAIKDWIISLKDSENLPQDIANGIMTGFGKIGEFIGKVFSKIREYFSNGMESVPGDLISGLVDGIWNGIKIAGQTIKYLAEAIIAKFKEVLGIHSPSTVFMAIGGFIIAGLISGMDNGLTEVWDFIKGVCSKIVGMFQELDLNKVIAVGLSAGILTIAGKLAGAFYNLTKPLESFDDLISNAADVVNKFSKVLGSASKLILAKALQAIAISIAILVASVIALTFVDPTKLAGAVAGVISLILALGWVAKTLGEMDMGSAENIAKFSAMMLSISAAILIIAFAMKMIGNIENMGQAVDGLTIIVVALIALIFVLAKLGNKVDKDMKAVMGIAKIGKSLLMIAGAIAILAIVFKILGNMNAEEIYTASDVLGTLVIAIGLLMAGIWAINKYSGDKGIDDLGNTLLKISGAIAILAIVCKFLGGMSEGEINTASTMITLLVSTILVLGTGLVAFSRFSGDKGLLGVGGTLLAMAAAIAILAVTMKILASMDWTDGATWAAYGALAAITVLIVGLVAATRLAGGNDLTKVGTTLLLLSVSIGILAGVAVLLALIPEDGLIKGITAVGFLALFVAGLVASTKLAQKCIGTIVALTAVIAILSGVMIALSCLDPTGVAIAGAALGLVMGMLALVIAMTGKAQKCIGTLIVLTIVIAAIGGILYLLANLPSEGVIASAVALSVVLLAISVVLAIITKIASKNPGALVLGLAGMAALILLLYPVIGALALMQGIQNAIQNAIVLGGFMAVLLVVLVVVAAVGAIYAATGGIAMLGFAGMAALILLLYPVIGALALMQGIQNAAANLMLLSGFMITMTKILVILAIVGPLALIGVTAMYALSGLMVAFGVLAVAIGKLNDMCPSLGVFLSTGLGLLEQIAEGLGRMIGKFITAFAGEVMQILPKLGMALSQFMINATGFIVGAKMVDQSVLSGVSILALAIMELTVAKLVEAVGSFLSGGASFADLGLKLSQFMMNAIPFITGLKLITPEASEAAHNLALLITAITVADVIEGVKSFLGIEGGIDTFGTKLASFGESMKTFLNSIADLTTEDLERVRVAAEAGKMMSEMADAIPKSGGWAQKILGESDMVSFSAGIVAFGEALVAFGGSVSTITEDDANRIKMATEAGTALSDLNNAIPKSGGWAQKIMGAQDLKTFGESIIAFGGSLVKYAQTVSAITEDDAAKISMSVEAGTALSKLQDSLPKSGGWWQEVVGAKDIGEFGKSIVSFATGLKDYAAVAKTIDDGAVTAITNSGKAVDAIKEVAEKVPTSGGWKEAIFGSADSGGFGEGVKSLATGIKTYVDVAKGITEESVTNIKNTKTAIEALTEVANSVPTTDAKKVSTFKSSMSDTVMAIKNYISTASLIKEEGITSINQTKTAADAIIEVTNTFSSINSETVSAGVTQINSVVGAISDMTLTNFSGVEKFTDALDTIANANVEGFSTTMSSLAKVGFTDFINSFKESFSLASEAGKDLITNIAEGITSGQDTIIGAIETIISVIASNGVRFNMAGAAAAQGFNQGLASQATSAAEAMSSVVEACCNTAAIKYTSFYTAGGYLVEGFASGIDANTWKAKARAKAMAEAAYKAAKEVLKINSPSKVFKEVGSSIPEGFALGIGMFGNGIKSAITDMSNGAIDKAKDSLSMITDIINGDIDTEPVIRPVLDLSAVESGAGSLNGMFSSKTLSVDTRAIGAISASMSRIQNGDNSGELLSTMKGLRSDIANMPRNTYTVNGITYDDGSNITNAVESLVRAARIERRT